MATARTVSENGSFRLIEQDGRYAVVEARDGRVYGLEGDGGNGGGERPSAPDRPDSVAAVVSSDGWTDEPEARRRFDTLVQDGDRLARTIW